MIKNETICDRCLTRITKRKCYLCDSDCCGECGKREKIIFEMFICKICSQKLKAIDEGNLMGDFLESLGINVKDNLKEFLIKKLVVSGLLNGEKGNGN